MKKTYETVDVFHRNGVAVPVGTRLVLHEAEAKYLGHVLRLVEQGEPRKAVVKAIRRRAQGE